MHCKCFPSVLFCSYFQMVLSFLAGSKHALVYANSGMHVTFFWFFAVSIYPLVWLTRSGAHLGLTVGLYMQRFFGRMKQL